MFCEGVKLSEEEPQPSGTLERKAAATKLPLQLLMFTQPCLSTASGHQLTRPPCSTAHDTDCAWSQASALACSMLNKRACCRGS